MAKVWMEVRKQLGPPTAELLLPSCSPCRCWEVRGRLSGKSDEKRPPGEEQGWFPPPPHWEYSQPYLTPPERSQQRKFPSITLFPTSYRMLGSPLTESQRVWETFYCNTKEVSPFCPSAPYVVFVWLESLCLQDKVSPAIVSLWGNVSHHIPSQSLKMLTTSAIFHLKNW